MTGKSAEEASAPESVVHVFWEVARSRSIILMTVIIDSSLLAFLIYIYLLVQALIGDVSRFTLIDRIVIIALQFIGAIGTIGLMFGYLCRDLIIAGKRLWKTDE